MKRTMRHLSQSQLTLLIIILCTEIAFGQKIVEMKIVDEPSSFGGNYAYNGINNNVLDDNLAVRVKPANFSGPQHFKRLIGRCFESEIQGYKYKFCPFANVTQHEQGVHWNPYKGVLGVWQEWEVKDNNFIAMLMKDGDECGNIYRSVRVSFICSNHSKIVNVTEPSKCSYHMDFTTPLVCAENSMLVFPGLEPDLQHSWNVLEGENIAGELTDKGYQMRLSKIFEKAGIYLSSEHKNVLVQKAEEEKKTKINKAGFESLSQCQAEYRKLEEEIESLKAQLKAPGNNQSDNGWQVTGDSQSREEYPI